MKRWAVRISLCIVLGVVTTMGVAWGLAWSFSRDAQWAEMTKGQTITAYHTNGWAARGIWITLQSEFGVEFVRVGHGAFVRDLMGQPDWSLTEEEREEADARAKARWNTADGTPLEVLPSWCQRISPVLDVPESGSEWSFLVGAGWPAIAVYSDSEDPFLGYNAAWFVRDDEHLFPRVIPYRPILPGFLINTLFYAVIWFVLFFGVGATRRGIRRTRGRCVKCGYDLRGTPGSPGAGCPECGWGRGA